MADFLDIQSKFQRIRIVNDPVNYGEHQLLLDDMWQYNSGYEYRYHETIALLPASCVENLTRVLILGGGDGLAVRELLKFPNVLIDLVEIDPIMIKLFRTEKMLTDLNKNSLNNERCRIHIQDAREYVYKVDKGTYDLVIMDFPSPGEKNEHREHLNLFTNEYLSMYEGLLRPWGVIASQTSVPTHLLVPFGRFFLEKGYYVWNVDCYYDEGTYDNFTFFCKKRMRQERELPFNTRFLTKDHVRVGFSDTTEVTNDDIEYYRLFQFADLVDVED